MSKKIIIVTAVFILFEYSLGFCFDNKITHRDITETAISSSQLNDILESRLGFTLGIETIIKYSDTSNNTIHKTIKKLLQDGSTDEDNPACRASNHFHNPLKAWNESGVNDFLIKDTWRAKKVKEFFAIYCDTIGGSEYVPWNSNITWATGETI